MTAGFRCIYTQLHTIATMCRCVTQCKPVCFLSQSKPQNTNTNTNNFKEKSTTIDPKRGSKRICFYKYSVFVRDASHKFFVKISQQQIVDVVAHHEIRKRKHKNGKMKQKNHFNEYFDCDKHCYLVRFGRNKLK